MEKDILKSGDEIAWCPGCGNFGILEALKRALLKRGRPPKETLLVSGIGQAAKLPHYVKCNCFNGLHGRALPVAVAAKMSNPVLDVLVTTGDGDCYGEGGNHFIHNLRRNVNVTVVVHNNQIYGLTKGQASPTTDVGYVTPVQTHGVIIEPFHALEIAITMGSGFVARGFSGKIEHLSELILAGMEYDGFAFIEVLQPCVSFNTKNTHKWYSEKVYVVNDDPSYDLENKNAAYARAGEWGDKIPTGIFYKHKKMSYERLSGIAERKPLADESIEDVDISGAIEDFKVK